MKKHNPDSYAGHLTKDEKKQAKAMRDSRKGKRMLWQSLEIKD